MSSQVDVPATDTELLRLQALARYDILDTLPEAPFERLAQLAARHFRVGAVSITLIDGQRQWAKASYGRGLWAVDREHSLCSTVFQGGEAVSSPDVHADARFADIAAGLPVRFYASAPLVTAEGHAIGSLCLADTQLRVALTADELDDLTAFATLVMNELELRLHSNQVERQAQGQAVFARELQDALNLSQTLQGVADLVELEMGPVELLLRAAELTAAAAGADWAGLAAVEGQRAVMVSAWQGPGGERLAGAARGYRQQDGHLLWKAAQAPAAAPLFIDVYPGQFGADETLLQAGAGAVVAVSVGGQGGVQYVLLLVRQVGPDLEAPAWSRADRQLVTAVVRTLRQAVERRIAQAALQRTQAQLRLTLEAGPLVLWATDMSGIFTVSEGRGLADIGLRPGDAVGHHFEALYAGNEHVLQSMRRALAGESFETTLDVGDQVFDASYAPLRGPEGRQVGTMGVAYAVTARAHAEAAERQARAQAEVLLELSRVLDPALPLHKVADAALAALAPALGDPLLLLLERRGEVFVPLSLRGHRGYTVPARLTDGVPVQTLQRTGVLDGQHVFLPREQLSTEAQEDGMQGAALLPVRCAPGPCTLETEIVLVVGRMLPFPEWSGVERELLDAAVWTLGAGVRRRQQHQRLEDAAHLDLLTGLGNRRAFEADLRRTLAVAERSHAAVGVLSIDLDGLKAVNDQQGHSQGDALLRCFAGALSKGFRSGDRAYRLGGDEYVLILPGAGPHDASAVMTRVQTAIQVTRQAGFAGVDASAGLACYPADAHDPAELLRLSDAQMYTRKAQKRMRK